MVFAISPGRDLGNMDVRTGENDTEPYKPMALPYFHLFFPLNQLVKHENLASQLGQRHNAPHPRPLSGFKSATDRFADLVRGLGSCFRRVEGMATCPD